MYVMIFWIKIHIYGVKKRKMKFNYNGLWKTLIDKNMEKTN